MVGSDVRGHLASPATHRVQKMFIKLQKRLVLVLLVQMERLSQFLAGAVWDTAVIRDALICAARAVCTFLSSLLIRTCHIVVKKKSQRKKHILLIYSIPWHVVELATSPVLHCCVGMAPSLNSTEGFQPLLLYAVNDSAWKEGFSISFGPDAGEEESTDTVRPSSEACHDVCKSVLVGLLMSTDKEVVAVAG